MSSIPATHVIQVTNVAPAATLEQMKELFGYLGRIRNIKLYPSSENYIIEPQSRVCYVQYYEKWSVGVAQHLTNTVFIDRALIVVPIADDGIPSESTALALTNPSSALPGLVSSGPNALINEVSTIDGSLVITTLDPKLAALGLPQYPPLSANLDPVKIEEIRRTVTVGNLDISTSAESLLKFVNQIGEVKFLRMGGDGIQTPKMAYVEFTDQSSIPKALQYNGVAFEGRPLLITHATNAIVKPLPKNTETAQKEIDEAMKRVKEAQSLITAAIEPELSDKVDKKKSRKSRSRSRSRRRSSSRSRHKRRSRSRSKRSRSKGRSSRARRLSKSPPRHIKHKSRSKSREKKKVVSPRHKRERTRSRSRDRKKGASSPHHKKEKSRSHSRERKKETSSHRHRKERSRSPIRSKKHKSKSRSPSISNSKSRKSKRSEEKSEKNRERAKSPKVNKSEKNELGFENKSALSPVENSQSDELYGPLLPVPEVNSSIVDNSLSLVQKFDSDMSYSPASLNTESVEVSQSASKDIGRKEHSFVKNITGFKDGRNQILMKNYRIDNDNTELNDAISSCQNILTNDSSEAIFNKQLSPTIDLYSNIDRNFSKSMHSDHQRESIPGLYEDISDLYGSSFSQTNNIPVISENSYNSSQSEDFIAKLNFDQRISNKSNNEACDISHLVGNSSFQSNVEAPQNISVISTLGLSSNKVEKVSSFFHAPYSPREKKNSTKSVSESNKHEASRSRSRSPITDNRTKSSRTRSRSLSKESSYSRKNKSRSVSKHRSRSRSRKRSRSRSKGSIRKTRSPSRNRHIRNRSRSHSSKRESYSPRRYSDSRRRMSSKRHSVSSRRRSITPVRKSRVPRRRSPTPRRRSRSPRHRSRSHSYRRSQSPPVSRTKNSSRSYRHSSRSPRRSQSPSDIRVGQKKNKRDNSKGRESKPMPISRIDSANINCNVVRNYDEEDYNLEKMMEEKGNDKTEFIPTIVENSLSYGYNSMDMDLGSLQ